MQPDLLSAQLPHPSSHYERLLASPLISFRNGQQFANIPTLKAHLEKAWRAELREKQSLLQTQPESGPAQAAAQAEQSGQSKDEGQPHLTTAKRKVQADEEDAAEDEGSSTEDEDEGARARARASKKRTVSKI